MRRVVVLALLALAGCSPAAVDAPSWPPVPEAAHGGVSVLELRASREGSALAAEVVTQGSAERARLLCRVHRGDAVVAEASADFAPAGTTLTRFQLGREGGWPAGTYRFEVELDGHPATSRDVQLD